LALFIGPWARTSNANVLFLFSKKSTLKTASTEHLVGLLAFEIGSYGLETTTKKVTPLAIWWTNYRNF